MLYNIAKGLCKFLYSLLYRIEVFGEENIPKDSGVIICPNHKSNHDAILVTVAIKRRLTYLGKEEVFRFAPLGWILKSIGAIPIKRGSGDIGAVRKSIEVLKEGKALTIFPEGTRNKTDEMLLEFKSGACLIGYKAQVPIVPCAIIGNYKPFSKVKLVFGKPINMVFDEKPDLHIVTDNLKNSVKTLMEVR